MIPEWIAIFVLFVGMAWGFLICGAIIGTTPFWNGVRDGLTLGLGRKK